MVHRHGNRNRIRLKDKNERARRNIQLTLALCCILSAGLLILGLRAERSRDDVGYSSML